MPTRPPFRIFSGPENNRSLAFSEIPDSTATLCWLMHDEIVRRLDKEIDSEVDPNSTPLSYEDRERKSAEIALDLLDVERQEAAAVWMAIAQNLPCEFRADCDPRATLKIQLVTVPRAPDGPSSPERAGYNLIGGTR